MAPGGSFFFVGNGHTLSRLAGSPGQSATGSEKAARGAVVEKRQLDGCGRVLLDGLEAPMPIQVRRGKAGLSELTRMLEGLICAVNWIRAIPFILMESISM
jgi:hypothetical protein